MSLRLVLIVVAALLAGVLVARLFPAPTRVVRDDDRRTAILSQAAQVAPGGTLVLGDSLVEYARIERLCGRPALNAGMAGATTAEVLALAPEVIARARPAKVVLVVGINDIARGTPVARWQADYRRLVVLARPVVVAGEDATPGWADARVAELNRFVAAQRVRYVPPLPRAPGMYTDLFHHSAAGTRRWLAMLDAACR